jgi:hypothetical protein
MRLLESPGIQGDRAAAVAEIDRRIANLADTPPQYRASTATLEAAREILASGKHLGGRMYEVNIHADPAKFLDWDKPLAQMGEPVREALAREWLAHPIDHAHQTGGQIYESARIVPGDYRDPASASTRLAEAGIPGIKYLDAGSRSTGDGSRNFVVFDPANIVEILRKYGVSSVAALPPAVQMAIQLGSQNGSDQRAGSEGVR